MTPAFAGEAFADVATRFCLWAEGESHDLFEGRQLLLKLLTLAPELEAFREADLPEPDDEEDFSVAAWKEGLKRWADLPFQHYRTVHSPLDFDAEEPVTGDLHDDFADIHADLLRGLNVHRAGHAEPAYAYWIAHYGHWGQHAVSALAAIEAYYREQAGHTGCS